MREIKFRAWDTKFETMFSKPDDIYLCLDGTIYDEEITVYDTPNKEIGLVDDNRYILMQYTGLKDKDGKEIYEGDIVRHKPINSENYQIDEIRISPTQGVVAGGVPLFLKYEIIGNIYENPELLDKEGR